MAPGQLTGQQAAAFARLSPLISPLLSQYQKQAAPSALMLSGPFGVGKSTLASLLAQALLCQGQDKPCGSCPACQKVRADSHPNLLTVGVMDRQRSVKVEQARKLLLELSTYPFSPGPRVVLLNRVDVFTPQAQNALLKTLEEPDSGTFFLLTCQNEQAVLITIHSRCQLLRLPPWPSDLLTELLQEQGLEKERASQLALLAQGSPGKALQIEHDPTFWQMKELADDCVLGLLDHASLPAASRRLKDQKDRADLLLDYLEGQAVNQQAGGHAKALALLNALVVARQQLASNLSWQAVIDNLLLSILEETNHA